jgi:hypothetical protein
MAALIFWEREAVDPVEAAAAVIMTEPRERAQLRRFKGITAVRETMSRILAQVAAEPVALAELPHYMLADWQEPGRRFQLLGHQ